MTLRARSSSSRRLPRMLGLGAVLCALAGAAVGPSTASAALSLEKDAPERVLFGTDSTVTLRATNADPGPYGYNLSFRDVLPEGVSFVPGSATFGGETIVPRVIADAPSAGQTTLLYENVADISVAGTQLISYR